MLKNLKRPNLKLEEVFKATREDVMTLTARKQVPWDSSSVQGDFYFSLTTTVKIPKSGPPVINETVTVKDPGAVEREAWSYIRDSANAQDFRDFLKDFPTGANAANAKIKLEQAVWDAVKDSRDKTKLQAYLSEFPTGVNAPLARIRLRQLDSPVVRGGNASVNERANPSNLTAGTVRKMPSGIELAYIPQGEFMMGSTDAEIDEALYECKKYNAECKREYFTPESPKHRVTIREGFWMGRYEVTQSQWQSVMGDNPSKFSDCGGNCPVEQVSWDDIQVFLKRLNAKNDGYVYSLPSEAQWEYAARAGTTTPFAFGDSLNSSQANFAGVNTHTPRQRAQTSAKPLQSDVIRRMRGDCTICTAMSGNGCRIFTIRVIMDCRLTAWQM